METTHAPATIVESIAIDAPQAVVFDALTDPNQIMRWWGGPDSHKLTSAESDLRPGGAWRSTGTTRTGEPFSVRGVYRAIDPPRTIEFTWIHDWSDDHKPSGETIVRYDVNESAGTTMVTVTHTGFVSQDERDDHESGWKTVLGWLRDYVTAHAR